MSVINDIKDSYNKGELIPFIGAGFSENIDGYPNWQKFIKILEDDINNKLSLNPRIIYYDIFGDDPLETTEHYVWTMGDWSIKEKSNGFPEPFQEGKKILLGKLKDLFSQHQYNHSKWSIHDKLVKKFNKTIYTTNWDDTLEKALNKNLEPIYRPAQFRTVKTQPYIIKFHGHYEDKDDKAFGESLIACETDYLKRISEENPFDIKFKNDLLHNDFLFIGYSFNDPNVKLVLYQIGEIMNRYKVPRKIFWLSSEYSDDKRVEMLTHRDIKPYFLLTDEQQLDLKKHEMDLKIECQPCCSFFRKCNDEKCDKYRKKKDIINAFDAMKNKHLQSEINNFLDKIQ